MTPYYEHGGIVLYHGDCREVLPSLSGVQACVTDPPYELGFMGKRWDSSGVAFQQATWDAVFATLLPGAHLLAFGGTRTYHRMTCAIEDAGFEIRDCLQWLYGSGFPKSLNVALAIDKEEGAIGHRAKAFRVAGAGDRADIQDANGTAGMAYQSPQTAAAQQWVGWGTALKPANEPIVLARKPLIGTVVANVLAHGTGAINVDGCRIGPASDKTPAPLKRNDSRPWFTTKSENLGGNDSLGRWPANVLHDGSAEVLALFPETTSGAVTVSAGQPVKGNWRANEGRSDPHVRGSSGQWDSNTGSAARFFYTAKASRAERGTGNTHPTVKPLDLMRWLVTLITPPDGLVLDPFAGSGTILLAARMLGRQAIGIEQDEAHCEIAVKRIEEAALLPFEAVI